MVASIVAPYILSMWTAQWPCFRQHVKAACRSTTFEVFQGDFAAVNPTGGGDTTLLYENETAIIFSHCVFSTVGAYFLKNNLLLLLCLQWQGQKHPNSTGATLRWSFVTWMRRCTWRQRAALWSRLVASSWVAAETQEEVWRRMYDNEARWEPEQAARVCVTDSASLTWNL